MKIRSDPEYRGRPYDRQVWSISQNAKVVEENGKAVIRCRFDVPKNQPTSEAPSKRKDFHEWRLALYGRVNGHIITKEFEVQIV